MRRLLVLPLAMIAMLLAPVAATAASSTFSISGTVSIPDGYGAEALTEIVVEAWNSDRESSPEAEVQVGRDGRYTIEGLPRGAYRVRALLEDYPTPRTSWATERSVNVAPTWYSKPRSVDGATVIDLASDVATVDIDLPRGRTLTGRVTLPQGGPADDLDVWQANVYSIDTSWTRWDRVAAIILASDGTFRVNNLPRGRVVIEADPVTGDQKSLVDQGADDGRAAVDLSDGDRTDLTIALQPGRTISGRVKLPSGGDSQAWKAVEVTALVTDSQAFAWQLIGSRGISPIADDGTFEVTGLPAGAVQVCARASNYRNEAGKLVYPNLATTCWKDASTYADAELIDLSATSERSDINITMGADDRLSVVTASELPRVAVAGKPVSVRAGTWSRPDVKVSYQWTIDGRPIPGTDSGTYVPALTDVGALLELTVTATLTDGSGATARSLPSTTVVADENAAFADISRDEASPFHTDFADAIEWMADQDISYGWSAGGEVNTYKPALPVTREAMAAFLYRFEGMPEIWGRGGAPFYDVSQDSSEFFDEITWMFTAGVSKGWMADGKRQYRPRATIARDAMAAFLFRLADDETYEAPDVSPFSDVPTSHPFYREISWMYDQGISTGWVGADGTREFRPLASTKRDAMAAFLYRARQSR